MINNIRIQDIALLFLLALMVSCAGKFRQAIVAGRPGLDDHKRFPVRLLEPDTSMLLSFSEPVHPLPGIDLDAVIEAYNGHGEVRRPISARSGSFDAFLEDMNTLVFIIIRNDSIIYERYYDGYSRESEISSFSLTKSVLSMLVGCAIEDGYIGSVHDTASKYVPELGPNGFDRVTIRQLLQMTSGINIDEVYYNPFRGPVDLYLSSDLYASMLKAKVVKEPGTTFSYRSGDSQVLGMVLDRALGEQTITGYMQEKLWWPLGMEYGGSWMIDREGDGLEKTFCCLSATPLDFARLGRLYLHGGDWNGRQIVPAEWVEESLKIDTLKGSDPHFQYHWRVHEDYFYAYGYAGQILYVEPAQNLIMLRMGNPRMKLNWRGFMPAVSGVLTGKPVTENVGAD